MEWLNYHHLLYFHAVAKEGGVSKAADYLHLAESTVSAQVKTLETNLGVKLFEKKGRQLELTEDGHVVYRYADEIFGMGQELLDILKGRASGRQLKLRVGISDALPKLVSQRLLEPAAHLDQPVQIVCHGDKTERLLAELAVRGLDLVLSDVPVGSRVKVRAFNHLLGESGLTFFAIPEIAKKYSDRFPKSLDGAPILLPSEHSYVRRSLEHWFEELDVHPRMVAEFDDTGLLKSFGQGGGGIFSAPTVVEDAITSQYDVEVLGRTDAVKERFYAITVERRIKHPVVVAITQAAKDMLFKQ